MSDHSETTKHVVDALSILTVVGTLEEVVMPLLEAIRKTKLKVANG